MVEFYHSPPIDTRSWNSFPVDHTVDPLEYRPELREILIPRNMIDMRVGMLAREISKNYVDSEKPLAICLLKGAITFFDSLTSSDGMFIEIDKTYWNVSSYEGTESTGEVRLDDKFNPEKVTGRSVILFDDIADTRRTLKRVSEELRSHKPKSLELAVLLDKPDRRVEEIEVDYCGFTILNRFVVGYGMDYQERFRDLNHIGVLKESVYQDK